MKKYLSLTIVFGFLFSLFFIPTNASKIFVSEKASSRRNIIEFEELAMCRLCEHVAMYDESNRINVSSFSGLISEADTEYGFNSSFGYISASKTDFSIQYIIMDTGSTGDSKDSASMSLYRCISALSALEYDDMAGRTIEIKYQFGQSEFENAYDAAADLWMYEIMPGMANALGKNPKKDTPILIYSGNYDYYVQFSDSRSGSAIYVLAQAR